jgi:hypothetical protein
MDFTYFIAAFIGLFVGFITAAAFLIAKRGSWQKILVIAVLAAIGLNAILLINWTKLDSLPPLLLLMDFGFIGIYTLVGCTTGAGPLLAARYAWSRHRRRSTE